MAETMWNDEKVEVLIETVRKYSALYIIKSRSYRDKTEKENAWKAVAIEVDMPGKSSYGVQYQKTFYIYTFKYLYCVISDI